MKEHDCPPESSASQSESVLAEVAEAVDEITCRIAAGEKVSLDDCYRRYPHVEDRLRRLLPAILAASEIVGDEIDSIEYPTPRELGGFRIVHQIGRGGMGVVYLAEQIGLERKVALKILPFAALLDDRQLTRFKNEARAAAMLKHPNIVAIHAVGAEQGINFHVMDYVDGPGLDAIISSMKEADVDSLGYPHDTTPLAKLTTARSTDRRSFYRSVSKLGVQLAEALHYAHSEGVIHRDIKPSNIMIDRGGTPHITDFGLARIQTDASITTTGDIVGTLRYMSPEQLEVDEFVDHRADIYALGLTLRELVGSSPAISDGPRESMIRDIVDGKVVPLSQLDSQVPADLETILAKATARDAADRYATAKALSDDLSNFLDHRPISARPPSQWEKLGRWRKRNPRLAIMAATTAILLVVVAALSTTVAFKEKQHGKSQAALIDEMQERDADGLLHFAQSAFKNTEYESAIAAFDKVTQKYVHRIDSFEYRYLKYELDQIRNVPKYQEWIDRYEARYSPDGAQLAVCGFDGAVTLIDAGDRRVVWHVDKKQKKGHRSFVWSVAFSTDGTLLFSAGEDRTDAGSIKVWDRTDGALLTEEPFDTVAPFRLAVSPDGKQLAVGVHTYEANINSTTVHLYNITRDRTGVRLESTAKLVASGTEIRAISYSADGKLLAAASDTDIVNVWSTATLRILKSSASFQPGVATSLAFSPVDKEQLAVVANYNSESLHGSDLYTWDIATGERDLKLRLNGRSNSVSWSRDGSQIAVTNTKNIEIFNTQQNSHVRSHYGHSSRVFTADFSPLDGKHMASASSDGSVRVWDTSHAYPPSELRLASANMPLGFGFSPDGSRLVSGYNYGPTTEWDLMTGSKSVELPTAVRSVWNVTYSRDGRYILYAGGDWPPSEESLGTIRLLDARTHREVRDFYSEIGALPFDCAFVPPGDRYVAGVTRGSIKIWDRETGELSQTINYGRADADRMLLGSLAKRISFDKKGRLLAVAFMNGGVTVWDLATGSEVHSRLGKTNYAVALSPDGTMIADATDHAIQILRISDGKVLLRLPEHTGGTYSLDFSPRGTRLLTAGKDGTMNLWNVATGNRVLSFHFEGWIQRARFSDDGRMIVVGNHVPANDGIIRIIRAP